MLGFLLIDKPVGITSHDVVNVLRRRLGTKRVGHAGTLDPLASGLLVVAVGPATRFLQYLNLEPKEYLADIRFGEATDSYDAEGDVTATLPVPDDLEGQIAAAMPGFLGLIKQIPPMFSAIKVKGKPLYKYARQGTEIEREPRTVHIGEYTFLSLEPPQGHARIVCSGGTYVRSLAHDLGSAVGCGAHLTGLRRTRVGRFHLAESVPLDQAGPEHLVPLGPALEPMPKLEINELQTRRVREGQPLGLADPPEARHVALVDPLGQVFSVARVQGNLLMPECVIPAEALPHAL